MWDQAGLVIDGMAGRSRKTPPFGGGGHWEHSFVAVSFAFGRVAPPGKQEKGRKRKEKREREEKKGEGI